MIKTPPEILPVSSTFGFHLMALWQDDIMVDPGRYGRSSEGEIVAAPMEVAFQEDYPRSPVCGGTQSG